MGKRIILCADDYGQDAAVSTAIVELATLGRISATSCMTVTRYWPQAAPRIRDLRSRIDVGLHFTLNGSGLPTNDSGYGGLGRLIVAAYSRRLDQTAIEKLLESQLDRFEQHAGAPPDFIDGHQHVHQLPVVRDALLAVYERRLRSSSAYIRSTATPSLRRPAWIKSLIIGALGAWPLVRRMDALGIPHNNDFSGVYRFGTEDYRRLVRSWLAAIADGGLMMCHPGLAGSSNTNDPIRQSREREYHYFTSEAFIRDCEEFDVRLARGRELGWAKDP
jgi:predicted glycoside hydrolase/deacetylase ChbG (UPF0249 family)